MDNRKYADLIDINLIDLTKQSLYVNVMLKNILKRFEHLLTELDQNIGEEAYRTINEEIMEKISSWVDGIYHNTRRKKITNNLQDIKKILPLFKENIKESLHLIQYQPKEKFKDNLYVVEQIISYSHSLFLQLSTILQLLKGIEKPIKYYYPSHSGYEIAFITLPEDINLDTNDVQDDLRNISKKYSNIPLLLHHDENFYLYGHKAKITKHTDKIKFEHTITLLNSEYINANLFSPEKYAVVVQNKLPKKIYKEIQEKEAHTHSNLAKKIETHSLILQMYQKHIKKYHETIEFYKEKESNATLRYKYSKISEFWLNLQKKMQSTDQLLEDNNQAITEIRIICDDVKSSLEIINQLIKDFRARLQQTHEFFLAEQTLEFIDKAAQEIRNQLSILFSYLEGYINHTQKNKAAFNSQLKKLEEPLKKFQTYSQTIHKNQTTDLIELETNMRNTFELVAKITAEKQSAEQACHLDDIIINAKSELLSIKQQLIFANDLKSKISNLFEQTTLLESQINQQHLTDSSPQIEKVHRVSSKKKPTPVIIESAEYIDTSNFYPPLFSIESPSKINQNQSKTLASFVKNQIKLSHWQTKGINKQIKIIDKATHKTGVKKPVLVTTNLNAPKHVNKMVAELNKIEIKKAKNNKEIDYETTISQLKKITQTALDKPSFFRTNHTAINYRRINYDIHAVKSLTQLPQPNESLQLIKRMNQRSPTNSILMIEFETKCQTLYASEIPIIDKLIQLYLTAKEYLYHETLTNDEKNYLYHIIFALLQVNVNASLQKIKNEIIKRCENKEWSLYLGGETININSVKHKVPKHVSQIWQSINNLAVNEVHPSHESSPFTDQADTYKLMDTLSDIMVTADRATFHPHCLRHADTQKFYMDIVNSPTFLQNNQEPVHLSECYVKI